MGSGEGFTMRVIKSRSLRWAGHVARMDEGRSAFKILTGKPTGKRPLGMGGQYYNGPSISKCQFEEIGSFGLA